jgi:hypothetical protein
MFSGPTPVIASTTSPLRRRTPEELARIDSSLTAVRLDAARWSCMRATTAPSC